MTALPEAEQRVTELQARLTELVLEKRALDHQACVEHFHRLMGQPVCHLPKVPSEERVRLRLRLISEEFIELLEATFGERCMIDNVAAMLANIIGGAEPGLGLRVNLPEFADALADLEYVIHGTHAEFGIKGHKVFAIVHAANLAKLGGTVRADGKLIKPADWQAPDIEGELRRQGWAS